MPQILVWKCPTTGKLFEEQTVYKNHLATLARDRRKVKQQNHIKNTFYDWLDHQRTNVVLSVDDIPQWILDNQQILKDAANVLSDYYSKFKDSDRYTQIKFSNVRWNANLSNSHSCPKGGVQNWRGNETFADGTPKPIGYPGWYINLSGSLQRNKKDMGSYPYSEVFKVIGIHTGSGGGGNENFGYDAKIFAEEWPGAASGQVFARLAGTI